MENNNASATPQAPGSGSGDGNTPPAATPQTPAPGATNDADRLAMLEKENEALKKSNADLVSQRDKNHNAAKDSNERLEQLESVVSPMMVKERLTDFLTENKADFPDVTIEDLSNIQSLDPEYLKGEATRLQTRFKQVQQQAIINIENPPKPALTAEQREAELDKLRKSKEPGRFGRMIALRRRA